MAGEHKVVRLTIGNSCLVFHASKQDLGIDMAAQKYLQLLHPHLKNWGDLLLLYGNQSVEAARTAEAQKKKGAKCCYLSY
jgi:microprocessor complex subunit DGCR8